MQERPENYQVRVKDLAEDSIEKCWIPLWDKVERVSLTESESDIFVKICFLEEHQAEDIISECLEKNDFAVCITRKSMMKRFDVKMDSKTQLWLAATFKSPGDSVMKFAYIKWKMHQSKLDKLTFDEFSRCICPFGWPSENDMQWLWDCQKLKAETEEERNNCPATGNMLDVGMAYKSFC